MQKVCGKRLLAVTKERGNGAIGPLSSQTKVLCPLEIDKIKNHIPQINDRQLVVFMNREGKTIVD